MEKEKEGIEDDEMRKEIERIGRNIIDEKRMMGKKGG